MNKKQQVSSLQVTLLIIILRVVIAFSYLPSVNSPPANQDVWISELLSIPYTILICLPFLFLSNKFNDYTFIEWLQIIFGKVVGKVIGILYSGVFSLFCLIFVMILAEILGSTMFTETPNWAIILIMLLTCSYIVYKGLRPMTKGAEVFVPVIMIITYIFPILGYKDFDFKILLPILKDSTFRDINFGAINNAFRFSDIMILCMYTPYLEEKKDLNKIFFKSLIWSTIILVSITVLCQTALGIEQTKHLNFPYFTFARLISVFDVVERIESIYVIGWIVSNIGKISAYFYFATLSLSQIFNKKDNRVYIIPLSIIIFIISSTIRGKRPVVGVNQFFKKIAFNTVLIFVLIIPLIAVIVYFIRRRFLEKNINE